RLLVDQLSDHAAELDARLLQVEASQALKIEPIDELPMDAELQVLTGPLGRRHGARAERPRRQLDRRPGRRRRALARQTQTILQLHGRTSVEKRRCSSRPRRRAAVAGLPASRAASSCTAAPSGDRRGSSSAPAFIAALAPLASAGSTAAAS